MGLDAYAFVIYGDNWLGEFELGRVSGTNTVLSDALYHIPSRGLPPEMPEYTSYPHRMMHRVVDEPLSDDEYESFVLRTKAEEDIRKGFCRWMGLKQNYVLYEPMSISWYELNEMPELLARLGEAWWILNRVAAIYELMKTVATAAPDGNARLVYWVA